MMHCDYVTILAECVAQGNNKFTKVVNWHQCLVSHDQITFLPFVNVSTTTKMQSDHTRLIKTTNNYLYQQY